MSRLSLALDPLFPGWRIPRGIRRRAGLPRRMRVVLRDAPDMAIPASLDRHAFVEAALILRFSREPDTVVIGCDLKAIRARSADLTFTLARRPAVLVRLLAEADSQVPGFLGSVSDGSADGIVGFCSEGARAILVPDPEFFQSRGYATTRAMARDAALPWRERRPEILWRGGTTGSGRISEEAMDVANPKLIQRTRLCLMLKGMPGADVAFAGVTQSEDMAADQARLEEAGLLGGHAGLQEWTGRRFAIDIDGNTNAWSNLFNRLLLGCCVIKIGSPAGFRQWYYGDLAPWRHFVPVKADMSDLLEKIDWCRSHSDECEAIAAEGQKLAMPMTFEREIARGAESINRAFGPAARNQVSAASLSM